MLELMLSWWRNFQLILFRRYQDGITQLMGGFVHREEEEGKGGTAAGEREGRGNGEAGEKEGPGKKCGRG